jgi:hypothetical protein
MSQCLFKNSAYEYNTGLKSTIDRVGQNHTYTVYIRYFWQENHQIYGHIRCIYTVLANPNNRGPTPYALIKATLRAYNTQIVCDPPGTKPTYLTPDARRTALQKQRCKSKSTHLDHQGSYECYQSHNVHLYNSSHLYSDKDARDGSTQLKHQGS